MSCAFANIVICSYFRHQNRLLEGTWHIVALGIQRAHELETKIITPFSNCRWIITTSWLSLMISSIDLWSVLWVIQGLGLWAPQTKSTYSPLAHLGTSLPRVELEELGPSMSLSLDRTRHESLNDWRGIGLDLLVIAGVNTYRFISVPEFDDWRKPEWMHSQVNSASCALALCHASYCLRMAKNGTECQVIPSEATTLKTEKDPS